jgi:AcrR family transcriptional regulator
MSRSGKFAPISKRVKARTPSADVERAIVDAAEQLLVAEGPDALTVRAIAAAAGVAPMSVYNHLGGKNGVLDALLIRGFDGLSGSMAEVDGDDPFEDLAEAGRRYRQFARDHPSHYALMFERSVPDYEPSALAMGHARATFKQLEVLVQRAMAAGAIAPGDAAEVAQRLWNTCHGTVSLELRGIGFCDDPLANAEATAYSMLRGLRTEA